MSDVMNKVHAERVEFRDVNPILHVKDVEASIEHYTKVLGFTFNWRASVFASVYRGNVNIFLCEDEQGQSGTWVWIDVSDADALHAEYAAAGAKIRSAPQKYQWGYEMQVEDIDGNVLRLSSDRKPDAEPGVWLRDDGSRWRQLDWEKWERVD